MLSAGLFVSFTWNRAPGILGAAAFVLVSAILPAPARAQAPIDLDKIRPETYQAAATRLPRGQAPKIDGRLDDEAWQLAPASGGFVQREPRPGAPSTERTEFRILYDDRRIYFAVWAFDSNAKGIIASEMKRDSGLTKGDRIAIVIDTFFDRRNGFYFATNPLGAKKDAQYTDNSRIRNNDWNAVWECRTSIDDQGWYVEIAIPLSQLRFKQGVGETRWGLNVARSIVRKNEETYWVPYPRIQAANGFAYLSNAGVLNGLRDLPSARRMEFVPFVAPQAGRTYNPDASLQKLDHYGFDARIGLTNSLTADLTYRTDFAQVEADQEVVNVTRFSLFFPEKRPFFTESATLFNYGKPGVETGEFGPGLLPLFYSRRIGLTDEGREVPIIGGGRVTGRAGRYSLGFMNLETDEVSFGGSSARVVPRANYTVARVRRDIFSGSSVGAIFLNREGGQGADYNRTVGADANLVFAGDHRLTLLGAKTFTPGVSGADSAFAVDFAVQKDRYNYDVTYLDVGKAFNAEMGYIQRTDTRRPRARAAWTPRPGWRGVRQLSFGGFAESYTTHDGHTESRSADAQAGATFDDTSQLTFDVYRDYDFLASPFRLGPGVIPAGGYWWTTGRAAYTSSPRLRVSGTGYVETGGYYDGEKTTVSGGVSIVARETLVIDLSYNHNRITLPAAPAYLTNTVSTRVSYSFSPSMFAKAFVQYNDDRRLASINLLFWSIYRPGSDLYVVYNQQWDTNLPGERFAQVKNRTLSVKVTYWLAR